MVRDYGELYARLLGESRGVSTAAAMARTSPGTKR
jgi:hypothetical protein